ncbi:GNAT family N-acetyltransferase [Pedobacter sp. FW305-3-2-15-E-R2A2]|uniref:GNAT family N-acetyltransferase n=1 Tax=Pedobacter sp. FW305-3-2-15-E-R2A2 TaxID=3140251 RepID=UPI003140A01B
MSQITHEISFQPDQVQIEQLKSWMISENKQRTGFVHDLSIVTNHSIENSLATITLANDVIGFVTWDIFKRTGYIAVAAVAPEYRRSGVGRYLIEALCARLLQQGVLALYLECAPAISEKFWRKMGFQKMPATKCYGNSDSPKLYKILLPVQTQSVSAAPYIQIYEWGSKKKLRWPLQYKSNTNELVQPIIMPVAGDWCIEYVKSEVPERPEKVKNFLSGNYFDDPFLIIISL